MTTKTCTTFPSYTWRDWREVIRSSADMSGFDREWWSLSLCKCSGSVWLSCPSADTNWEYPEVTAAIGDNMDLHSQQLYRSRQSKTACRSSQSLEVDLCWEDFLSQMCALKSIPWIFFHYLCQVLVWTPAWFNYSILCKGFHSWAMRGEKNDLLLFQSCCLLSLFHAYSFL